MTVEDGECVSL